MSDVIVGPPEVDTMITYEDDSLHEMVYAQCATFSRVTGVEITERAQRVIADILDSFASEPHPSWNAERDMRTHIRNVEFYVRELPKYLESITGTRGFSGRITSFDILIWFSRNVSSICVYFCPF